MQKTLSELLRDPQLRGVEEEAAATVYNEIVVRGDEVHWGDISGLDVAKRALKEAVVYPFLRPDLYKGLREPAMGILLFGPPGTGKTMLALAVATESKSSFFKISASSLTSKWLGESEKLVRALFALAKAMAPSVIFVDEIDSLLSSRTSGSGEHDETRRMKTEFLIHWSALTSAVARQTLRTEQKRVLVLGATNLPWTIDEAAQRRFARRIYIPLPEQHVREAQLRELLKEECHGLDRNDIAKLTELTNGFSGSDISLLAKDAAQGPLRSLGNKLLQIRAQDVRPILLRDFEASLVHIRPSVSQNSLGKYEEWAKDFGETGSLAPDDEDSDPPPREKSFQSSPPGTSSQDGAVLSNNVATEGYTAVLDRLQELGIDPKAAADDGDTPMRRAVRSGDTSAVYYLRGLGLDPNVKSKDGFTLLHFAAAYGHIAMLDLLRELGLDLKEKSNTGRTPMHEAASAGFTAMVDHLRGLGMDLNTKDNDGNTPMHLAASEGHVPVIVQLHALGCDVNARNNAGQAPLHTAVLFAPTATVSRLLDIGANLNMRVVSHGNTPMHLAVVEDRLEIAQELFAKGSNIKDLTYDSESALFLASSLGHTEIVRWLLEIGADVNFRNRSEPMLLLSIFNGHEEVVKLLIENGADLEVTGPFKLKPLYVAALYDKPEIARLLLSRGADPRCKGRDGSSLIHLFAEHGQVDLVQKCLELDSNYSTTNDLGQTPLHGAAACGQHEVVKLLLDKGYQVDHPSKGGWTAAHRASWQGQLEILKTLLSRGANPSSTTTTGETPMHLAAGKGFIGVLRELQKYGASPTAQCTKNWQPIHHAAENCHSDVVLELLIMGATALCASVSGMTPLHSAALGGSPSVVKLLLQEGAVIDSQTKDGYTPLFYATGEDTVRLLIGEGANVNAQSKFGSSVLHDCVVKANIDKARALIELGADSNTSNNNGYTPLDIAAQAYQVEMAMILLASGAKTDTLGVYGRSPLYWLDRCDSSIRSKLPNGQTTQELNDDEWKAWLRTDAIKLKAKILESDLSDVSIELNRLKKQLTFLGKEEDAAVLYDNGLKYVEGVAEHPAWCEVCGDNKNRIKGIRYICTECPDMDLCQKDYDEYVAKKLKIKGCQNHRFIQVPRGHKNHDAAPVDDEDKLREWLSNLDL